MKIVINGRFLTRRITGVERYAHEILLELDRMIQPGEIEMAVPPEAEKLPQYTNIRVVKIGKLKNRLWEHISFPGYVRKQRATALNLCNVAPLSAPGIVCIHDVKFRAHPEFFSRTFNLWYLLLFRNETRRAKAIITVSEFSKREIIKYYHVPESRITVIPNGWQHYERIAFDENTLNRYQLEKNGFYFAMGSLEPNKNFAWVAQMAKNMPEQIFAVAGSINNKVFADGLGFECPSNMKLLGYVTDEEAKTLMRDCRAFLFPSIYEGFGIPPLEAMSAGCPRILVSDTEVMHEVFGDDVEYITNWEWPETESSNAASVKPAVSLYSWKKSAAVLYEMLQGIGG